MPVRGSQSWSFDGSSGVHNRMHRRRCARKEVYEGFKRGTSRAALREKEPSIGYSATPAARHSRAVRRDFWDAEKVICSQLKLAKKREEWPPNGEELVKAARDDGYAKPREAWEEAVLKPGVTVSFVPPGPRRARCLVKGKVLKLPDKKHKYVAVERLNHCGAGLLSNIEVLPVEKVVAERAYFPPKSMCANKRRLARSQRRLKGIE